MASDGYWGTDGMQVSSYEEIFFCCLKAACVEAAVDAKEDCDIGSSTWLQGEDRKSL